MGYFDSKSDVRRFLESQPGYPKCNAAGHVRDERVDAILTNPPLRGLHRVAVLGGIPLTRGKHQGLVSLETYERVQSRLAGKSVAPVRADLHEDFPLRGFVVCADCGYALTGGWSTGGNSTKHPYYNCHHRGCPNKGKTVRRADLERSVEAVLKAVAPSEGLIELARELLRDAWNRRCEEDSENRQALKRQLAELNLRCTALIDRIAASTPMLQATYEKRLEELTRDRLVVAERIEKRSTSASGFEEVFEHAVRLLVNPYAIWENGDSAWKNAVLKLVFAERVAYDRKTGLRTPKTTFPFKWLSGIQVDGVEMVEGAGFEPA